MLTRTECDGSDRRFLTGWDAAAEGQRPAGLYGLDEGTRNSGTAGTTSADGIKRVARGLWQRRGNRTHP